MKYQIFSNNNKYEDKIDISLRKVMSLVANKEISPRLASFLMKYLLYKNTQESARDYVDIIFHDKRIEKTFLINYSSKHTNYLI